MKPPQSSATNASAGSAPPLPAKTVRDVTAGWTEKSPDELHESTSFENDLKCSQMTIGLIIKEIECELAFSMGIDWKQVQLAELEVGGRSIWQQLLDKVKEHLPQVELPQGAAASKGLTIGILEQLIAQILIGKAGSGETATQPPPPTDSAVVQAWTWDQQNWMWQLPQELGPRHLKRLLVAGFRYAEDPKRHYPEEAEEFDEVLDIMEQYAETGKSKAAINKAIRIVNQWKWWKDRSAEGIHAFLHEPNSEVVLPKMMTAIADRRKLQPPAAFECLQLLYKKISENSSDTDAPAKNSGKSKTASKAAKASELAGPAESATTPPAGGTRYFEFRDEKSDKFWEISLNEVKVTVRFGRTGTTGQTQEKSFSSADEASRHATKLIDEKLKKGYVER